MPGDTFIPIPFKEPVWRFVGVLSAPSGYYVDSFDETAEPDTIAEDSAQLVSTTLDVAPFLSLTVVPPATVEVLVAADPDYYGFEMDALYPRGPPFDDYANDTTLDVTPAFFPPAAVEPIETFAAQPTFGEHDQATLIPVETEDYQPGPEQNEWTAPPEVPTEGIAAQPLAEQPWFPDQETEDYGPAPEQLEFLAPPEIIVPAIIAAQPHYGEDFDEAAETEDYQADSSLDTTSTLFPAGVEPVETFAAQPLAEQAWFPDTELEDYQAPAEQSEFLAPPEVPVTELTAAQPHYGEAFWPEAETEDYQHDATLDTTSTLFPTAAEAIEVFAAQPHYGEPWLEPEQIEDYAATSTIEVPAVLVPPPLSDAGLQAAAQLPEHDFAALTPVETEDYANDTALDVPVLVPVPANVAVLVASGYSTFYGDVEALSPETLEDYQATSVLEITFAIAQPPPPPVFITEGDANAAVSMQGDGAMLAAVDYYTFDDPTATYDDLVVTYDDLTHVSVSGIEGDEAAQGTIEGDGDAVGLLEGDERAATGFEGG